MFFVQGLFAVTHRVVVLDVIVNERSFVETLDRNRDLPDVLGQRGFGVLAQRLKGRNRQERPPPFAGPLEPIPRDAFGLAFGIAHDQVERGRAKPEFDLIAQRPQVEPPRPVVAGEMDVLPDPVEVHGCVNAVVLQQGDGDSGNGGRLHVRKGALEHAQATDAHDGLDLAGLNE